MNELITIIGSLTLITTTLVEFFKKSIYNKNTTLVAFVIAEIVTWGATYFKVIGFDVVATCVLGLVVGLASVVGFDKIKEVIEKLKF